MRITSKSHNLEITDILQEYIDLRFLPISKFLSHYDLDTIEINLELQRISAHNKGDVYRVEANLNIPKKNFRIEKEGSDIRMVLDEVKDVLTNDIKRHNEITYKNHK